MAPNMHADGEVSTGLAQAFQGVLDRFVAQDPVVRSGVLRLEAPGVRWAGASGLANPPSGQQMHPDSQFRTASIAKMITATTIMTLVEEGRLALDGPLADYLPPAITATLHQWEGRSCGDRLTPRQLLTHTSGLADYWNDGAPNAEGLSPFGALLLAEPDRLWDPLDILAWTKHHLSPHFPPGQGWHYSDTGYVVLGLLIEAVTGSSLHEVYRDRIFAPLGMTHTYLAFREPPRPSIPGWAESHAYVGDLEYTALRSFSADWGGGGLVTTTADLTRFLRAFAGGQIFQTPSSSQAMLTTVATGEPGVCYGLGVRRLNLEELGMTGFGEIWGHTGFLRSFALNWPAADAILVGTLNQAQAPGVWSEARPVAPIVPALLQVLKGAGDHPPMTGAKCSQNRTRGDASSVRRFCIQMPWWSRP